MNVTYGSKLKTYGDGNFVIGEDQGGVDTGEFTVGHFEFLEFEMFVQDVDFIPTLAQREIRHDSFSQEERKRTLNCLLRLRSRKFKKKAKYQDQKGVFVWYSDSDVTSEKQIKKFEAKKSRKKSLLLSKLISNSANRINIETT